MLILGNFRHSIEIQGKGTIKDEYGAEKPVWTKVMTLKADIKTGKGSKAVNADEVFSVHYIVFSVHYRKGISTDNRIIFESKKYSINFIEEIGFREGLNLHTELIND